MGSIREKDYGKISKLVSLDLEMNQPSGKIIQIGIALADYETRSMISRHSFIVDPGEPIQDRIVQLTGITDAQIAEHGTDLQTAFDRMKQAIPEDAFLNPVVWGGGDSECLRSQLSDKRPWCFGRRSIDVKTIFIAYRMARGEKFFGGLGKSLTKIGLKFDGRKHDAADDAHNTMMAFFRLMDLMVPESKGPDLSHDDRDTSVVLA